MAPYIHTSWLALFIIPPSRGSNVINRHSEWAFSITLHAIWLGKSLTINTYMDNMHHTHIACIYSPNYNIHTSMHRLSCCRSRSQTRFCGESSLGTRLGCFMFPQLINGFEVSQLIGLSTCIQVTFFFPLKVQ